MTKVNEAEHARSHPEDFLPFVAAEDGKCHYWQPVRTGDSHIDHCIGVIYGLYCIEYLRIVGVADVAREIADCMPFPHGSVEQGFFDALAEYITTGEIVSLSGFKVLLRPSL